jgi:hypothetical protein
MKVKIAANGEKLEKLLSSLDSMATNAMKHPNDLDMHRQLRELVAQTKEETAKTSLLAKEAADDRIAKAAATAKPIDKRVPKGNDFSKI